MVSTIRISTPGQGLHEFTRDVQKLVAKSDINEGLCTIFVQHTSCSLTIQENADPSARHDLENFICKLVPENDPDFTHTFEGPDDMPSHIKAALTATSLSIPIANGALTLGTWQGIYLWEHRIAPHTRKIAVHVGG